MIAMIETNLDFVLTISLTIFFFSELFFLLFLFTPSLLNIEALNIGALPQTPQGLCPWTPPGELEFPWTPQLFTMQVNRIEKQLLLWEKAK